MFAWRVLGCSLLCSCVLPSYQIIGTANKDAGTELDAAPATSSRSDALASAPAECGACAAEACAEERDACGDDCASMPWPISPAWKPAADSAAFVKCLVNKCDPQCNVSWGCVDKYAWTQPTEAYTVSIQLGNAFNQAPDVKARVTACQAGDPGCSVGTGKEGSTLTDENGVATLTLDPDFIGYFLIEPSDPKYYAMTMLWSMPTYRVERRFWVNLFERTWLDAMADSLKVKKDDEKSGHVIFRAENCLPIDYLGDQDGNAEAEGVKVAYSPSGLDSTGVFYTTIGLMVDALLQATQAKGRAYGGALNLPPGSLTLVGSHGDKDVTRATLRIRPNTLALVHLVPDGR
jgi:hypothetical protein